MRSLCPRSRLPSAQVAVSFVSSCPVLYLLVENQQSGALSWWMMEPEATAFTIMDDGAQRHRIPVPFLFSNRDRPWTGRWWEGENCTWESGADIKASCDFIT
ncbi:hypothetical protein C4D60_Mb10t11490 [Musa balbisiana]|uniref:Uncharacterized protein n=1 Tax=Musa balbisiana TaxID=52838 RepID=A0A4S8IYU2_MUSBA|nr:hypothetical protein C4D60_Mb10t11490 [Musa balbisiana]